jgi:dephospho-CoA kinase
VLLVGLTGGIGSGKSTVARLLEKRGAVVFDADVLARRAVDPGTPGYVAAVERFGPGIVREDGEIDREALGRVVFADAEARADLEAIVHPEVRRLFAEGSDRYRDSDAVVVFGAPLLVETGLYRAFDVLVVVSASERAQIERLASARGMSEDDVRARMAAQFPLERKAEVADILLDNDGSMDSLEHQVDRLWADLRDRSSAKSASAAG